MATDQLGGGAGARLSLEVAAPFRTRYPAIHRAFRDEGRIASLALEFVL